MPAPTRLHPFPDTRWTLVARSCAANEAIGRVALEDLCKAYWFPLYAFARARGHAPQDAEDHTQNFFSHILARDFFSQADANRGKLRTFLLNAFTQYLINAQRNATRQKRGGGMPILSIDLETTEGRLQHEPATAISIERLFEKRWAQALVDACMVTLAESYTAREKAGHFQALRTFLDGTADATTYQTAATALGISIVTTRQEVSRMRTRFREIMHRAVADTLENPTAAEVEAELTELKRALRE